MSRFYKLFKESRAALNNLRLPTKIQSPLSKDPQLLTTYACIYYGDHSLVVASVGSDGLSIRVGESASIPVPSHVANDSNIHKQNDLIDILSDLLHLLDLDGCPVILLLATSLFSFSSFKTLSNELLTLDDTSVSAASPYLPHETLISTSTYRSGKDYSQSISYVSRKLIDGWFSVLSSCDCKPALICPAAANSLGALLSAGGHSSSILCDIELSKTSLFFCGPSGPSSSKRLPYGTALYLSATSANQSLAPEFFDRLIESVNELIAEIKEATPTGIFVSGIGFDRLLPFTSDLPYGLTDLTTQPVKTSRMKGFKLPIASTTLTPSLVSYFSSSILNLYNQ